MQNYDKLQVQNQDLVDKLSCQPFKNNPLNRSHVVEVLRDIDGRDKMASLWGISEKMLLLKGKTQHWIKSRKNAGMQLLAQMNDVELAKEIFKAWDVENKGYLSVEELTDQLVGLGLATNKSFVERLLETLTKGSKKLELLTLKQFLKVFSYNKFGMQACDIIVQEFQDQQQ